MAKTKTKKAAPKTTTLNVVLVWDMSGSMMSLRASALEGATAYINDLTKDESADKMRLSVVAFDTVFERWFTDMELSKVPIEMLGDLYKPRGWTALNDAVADAVFTMDKLLTGDRAKERALIVVLTDGLENSSKEFGGVDGTAALAEIIKQREETGRWTFIYLGAGKPAEVAAVAETYNIPRGNSMAYAASASGVSNTYYAASRMTSALSGSTRGQTVTATADAGYLSADEQEEELS